MKLRSLAATALAACLAFSVAPVTSASTPNLVMFGDSLTANPTVRQAMTEGICAQSDDNIARQVAGNLSLEARDFSCSGAGVATGGFAYGNNQNNPLKTFRTQVETAVNSNSLDADTRYVLITVGFNDTYIFPPQTSDLLNDYAKSSVEALSAGSQVPPVSDGVQSFYDAQKANWDREIDNALPQIRAAAPNARIVFSEYPAISDDAGNNCLVHLYGVPDIPTSIFWLAQGEQNVDVWLEQASVRHNGQFVNLRAATQPNNQCADVVNREVAGLIDTTTQGPWNLPGHPTSRGTANAANIITEQIR